MSICVRCNTPNVEDAQYCDECGALLGSRPHAASDDLDASVGDSIADPVAAADDDAGASIDVRRRFADAPTLVRADSQAPNGGRTMPFSVVPASTQIHARIEADSQPDEELAIAGRESPADGNPFGSRFGAAATRTLSEIGLARPELSARGEPAQGAAHAKLVIERGRSAGKGFLINDREAQIGRWDADGGIFPDVDLDADDPEAKVSRRHARIVLRADGYYIEDLGSTNGTFINRGRRLMPGAPQALRDGDEIIVGKTFLRLHIIN